MSAVMYQTHAQQLLELLSQYSPLNKIKIMQQTKLTEGEVSRAILFLKKNVPPLINELGNTGKYQLSREAQKTMGVAVPTISFPQINPSLPFISPGPRGQLVKALRHYSKAVDIARYCNMNIAKTRYYLEKLDEKGLIKSERHGRAIDYRLATEPSKPILTPSLIPLSDPTDWKTWAERLVLEQCGGPKIIVEEKIENFGNYQHTSNVKTHILLVGRIDASLKSTIEKEFNKEIRFHYLDPFQRNPRIRSLAKRMHYVFVRADHCSHKATDSIKAGGVYPINIYGGPDRICKSIKNYLPS